MQITPLLREQKAHAVIPGNGKKHRRHYSDDTSCCVCSNQREDYQHFLFACPVAKSVWRWFVLVWSATTGNLLDDSLRSVLLASLPPSRIRRELKHTFTVLSVAHGELLYSLWLCRCRAVFDEAPHEFTKPVITSVAKFRINRALASVASYHRWSSARLTALTRTLETEMDNRDHWV